MPHAPAQTNPPPSASLRPSVFAAAAVLAALIVVAYANTFQVPFLLDDRSAITENPTLGNLGDLGTVLAPTKITTSGRPLLNLSFALNHAAGGQAVAGYHAVNLAIHLAGALVLFGVLRRTLRPSPADAGDRSALLAGFFGALLWAVHPVLTSAVTYLSQRAESLMGLFYLATLYAFIRSKEGSRQAMWASLSVACCWAGMMTKEVMVTAPVVVWFYDRVFCSRSFAAALRARPGYYVVLAASWALLAYLAVSTHLGDRSVGLRAGADWWLYALTEFKVVVAYVKLALWPSPLVFDYGQEILVRDFGSSLPYAIAVLAGLAAAVWLCVRGRLALGFACATFFILLSPTSSFIPVVGQPMAESRLYLPLIPVVALVVLGLHRLLRNGAWYVCGGLALILGALTLLRNQDFQSALVLWEDTIRKHPDNSRAQYNFANELARTPGRSAEALAHYEQALRLKPDLMEAHHNLANELAKDPALIDEALAHYEEALRLRPDLAEAHANAARMLDRIPARLPEAAEHWRQAVALNPDFAEGRFYLANDLAKTPGRTGDAIEEYAHALRLKPNWVEVHNNLANELAKVPGRLPEAIAHYEEALRLKPDYPEAHCNLANKLARLPGRMPEALAHYEEALRLRPDFLEAHYNYANKLATLPGRLPDAAAHFETVLRLNPNLPDAHVNLARVLANLGQLADAARHLETALALRPDDAAAATLLAQVRAAQGR
ncbi:MAG: hypothetical protein JWM88_3222 [Verrucomicrobia bacterium]|nr:hypothetical protein [Verrucomicrobiota bacterium]